MTEKQSTVILKLQDIASWWVPNIEPLNSPVTAALPAIQRGYVWKPEQVEYLWDSIAQGFPIGSLLLSDFNTKQGKSAGEGGKIKSIDYKYHLLDGQQRATSIGLGFRNIWAEDSNNKYPEPMNVLWVDLEPLNKDRRFSFRLCTKAHPWGYKRSNPKSKLSASEVGAALKVFRTHSGSNEKTKPHGLDLRWVFPWDAVAPIPVAILIEAINHPGSNSDVGNICQYILEQTDFLKFKYAKTKSIQKTFEKLQNTSSDELLELISGISTSLDKLEVPAPILPVNLLTRSHASTNEEDVNNSMFNLFERINNKGTGLTREEINYSMFKNAWPEAQERIENELLKDRQIAQPARLASLLIRLFVMIEEDIKGKASSKDKALQPILTIEQFRQRLNDADFYHKLTLFCGKPASETLENVWNLLTPNNFGLPRYLAAQISQQHDDLMLLIMYWSHLTKTPLLNETNKKKVLGFITAIAWFSNEPSRCLNQLGKELNAVKEGNISDILNFFNCDRLATLLQLDERGRVLMLPLPEPCCLRKSLSEPKPWEENELVKTDSLWNLYAEDRTPEAIATFFLKSLGDNIKSDDLDVTLEQKTKEAWWTFLHRVVYGSDRRLILYAQREILNDNDWFGWFDPTLPKQIADHNRPWDYDHILPHSWSHDGRGVFSGLSDSVRIWINSNGNLRVWPLELNRSKGAHEIFEKKVVEYGLEDKLSVKEKSFIIERTKDGKCPWDLLEDKIPKEGLNYKFWDTKSGYDHWHIFVEVAIDRTVDLYEEWYNQLDIKNLINTKHCLCKSGQ
jgi:hypothetical protein